jgi:ABC transport system ATP-binding/permease protein
MAPPLLLLQDIALTFGGEPLLEAASLSVPAGERLCLVGRNGSGKSTLLKIAAGLIEPDSGMRFLQPGVNLRYLAQEPDLSGYGAARAYVEAGLGPTHDRHRATTLLNELGLSGEEDTARLSGGEARRVALARVLAPKPDILLLDEPTNHLDLPAIEWLEAELEGARSARRSNRSAWAKPRTLAEPEGMAACFLKQCCGSRARVASGGTWRRRSATRTPSSSGCAIGCSRCYPTEFRRSL